MIYYFGDKKRPCPGVIGLFLPLSRMKQMFAKFYDTSCFWRGNTCRILKCFTDHGFVIIYKRKIVLKVFLRLDFFSAQSAFCFFIDSAILSKVLPDVALSKEKDRGEIHFINNILDHRPVLCKLPSLSWVLEFLY